MHQVKCTTFQVFHSIHKCKECRVSLLVPVRAQVWRMEWVEIRAGMNVEIWLQIFVSNMPRNSNIRYWMTSGIGLPYISIAVAESADHLARSFDVTLCKHCVNIPTKTSAAVFSAGHYTLRSCRYVRTFTHTCSCATVANGLRVCKNASRLLPSILAILCQYSTPINTRHAGSSSCSRKRADKLDVNRSTTGTASPSRMVHSKLINVSSV